MAEIGSPHAPPGIARVMAPILFGPMINWALYGVLCVQTFYFVFLQETAQTALTGADVYYWFMAGFGGFDGLKKSRFSPIDIPTMDAFISPLIVQIFFCYRIWMLRKRLWWLCIPIVAWPSATAFYYSGDRGSVVASRQVSYKPISLVVVIWSLKLSQSAALGKMSTGRQLAVALTRTAKAMWLTVENKHANEYKPFESLAIAFRLTSSLATVAIVSFALYIGFPNDIYYACPYSNTLLVTLNNRIYFRDHLFPGGLGSTGICPGPSSHSAHNLPQVRPRGIATANGTITLNSFSSATDLEKYIQAHTYRDIILGRRVRHLLTTFTGGGGTG
ncbi:hypothetical protein DFH94DRAFT_685128 [Russula ochroleuca]|uniref:Uncharacterized protein n=1 Tax=Russula ochroleuca TaxID=152965 RepID=A0A9P5MMD5_9AGAM|nr:hypothetical protein DFH94DRAFT_685128 [Russula ochroleuca]